jgi:glycosyltransferase involved in cell wall biosynthesis
MIMAATPSCLPALSVIIPTRERAAYLGYSIRTCIANSNPNLEILILDNASTDNTQEVVSRITDPRIRYILNPKRLSMRDNFEKGITESRGDVLCFIGDDDGIMPHAVDTALALFTNHQVQAVSAARAHYFWPDLISSRRNTALLPRGCKVKTLNSKFELKNVLIDNDYYRLPCLYHGFVKRSVVENIRKRQGRFFLSSQVDMFSSIALSMQDIPYAFSEAPLVINGGSSRSNGASHFGGGDDKEKSLWRQEDDIGFLPNFEPCLTVGALIIESAVRYCQAHQLSNINQVLEPIQINQALANECMTRKKNGMSHEQQQAIYAGAMMQTLEAPHHPNYSYLPTQRLSDLLSAFLKTKPLNMQSRGITDIHAAAQCMQHLLDLGNTGILSGTREQISTALKISSKLKNV